MKRPCSVEHIKTFRTRADYRWMTYTSLIGCHLIHSHQCGDAIERLYHSAGYKDIFFVPHQIWSTLPDSVYPICSAAWKQTDDSDSD